MARSTARRFRRLAEEETGYSLIELLLVVSLLVIVLGAPLMLLEETARVAPRDQERAHSIGEAQVGLHRMVRELRHAYAFNPAAPPTATQIDVLLRSQGTYKRVRYSCARPNPDPGYARCLRYQGPADFGQALGNETLVVDRVLNDAAVSPVFNRVSSNYIEAKIEVPARGERKVGFEHKVVLDDGFFMRNCRTAC